MSKIKTMNEKGGGSSKGTGKVSGYLSNRKYQKPVVRDDGLGGTKHGRNMAPKTDPLILKKRIKKNSPPKKPTFKQSAHPVQTATPKYTKVRKHIVMSKAKGGKIINRKRNRKGYTQNDTENVYKPFMM